MRKILYYTILIICTQLNNLYAQDPHVTQIMKTGAALNPAAAGQNVEYIRATLLYRNQWASVQSPFTTQALFFDKSVNRVGLGFNIINNGAGDAGLRQTHLNGNIAYTFHAGKNKIAAGVQLGLISKSFDPSKMTFDDQYIQDQGFDPANPTSESFSYTKLTRPDVGAGLYWTRKPGAKALPFAGLSIQHLNQPKESFILEDNTIPVRFNFSSGVAFNLNEQLTLTPMISWSKQFTAQEIVVGSVVKIPVQEQQNVEAGIFYRNQDAIALYAGYRYNSFAAGISYDANISGVTGGPGAFELTLTYIPKAKAKKHEAPKKEKEKKEKTPAPVSAKPAKEIKSEKPNAEKPKAVPVAPAEEIKKVVVPVKAIATKPPADTDEDGVEDASDECIHLKGTIATKGCPDSDKDGVADKIDKCPMEKGTSLNNGCPVSKMNTSEKAGMIQFKTNSDEVKGIIRLEIIEPILDTLYKHPEWKVVISGHTDTEGSDMYNMELSQRRADAIKAIFIRKGLDESRISTVCFGESQPLDNNRSEEGKAANRRAEIHIGK